MGWKFTIDTPCLFAGCLYSNFPMFWKFLDTWKGFHIPFGFNCIRSTCMETCGATSCRRIIILHGWVMGDCNYSTLSYEGLRLLNGLACATAVPKPRYSSSKIFQAHFWYFQNIANKAAKCALNAANTMERNMVAKKKVSAKRIHDCQCVLCGQPEGSVLLLWCKFIKMSVWQNGTPCQAPTMVPIPNMTMPAFCWCILFVLDVPQCWAFKCSVGAPPKRAPPKILTNMEHLVGPGQWNTLSKPFMFKLKTRPCHVTLVSFSSFIFLCWHFWKMGPPPFAMQGQAMVWRK